MVSEPYIDGSLQNGTIYSRPVDILSVGKDAFLITDDYADVVYFISETQTR